MKGLLKGIILLVALGAIGFGIFHFFFAESNARACDRLAELCAGSAQKSAVARCTGFFERLEQAGGKENIARSRKCLLESKNCPAALGCMVGAGLNAAGDFLDGVRRSLGEQKK